MPSRLSAALVLLMLSCSAALYAAEIEDFIARGDYRGAYELAQKQAPLREGDSDFDYLYALAALESGHADEAVFALERVVANRPGDHRARLELARALFMIGDYPSAAQQFRMVRDTDPPENVALRIDGFLQQIALREQARRYQLDGNLQIALGHDDNINSATSNSEIRVPALGIVQLSEDASRQQDDFSEVLANGYAARMLNKKDRLFLSAAASARDHRNSDTFDTISYSLGVGYQGERSGFHIKVPLQRDTLYVGNDKVRDVNKIGIEVVMDSKPWLAPHYYLQFGNLDYAAQTDRNARYYLSGAGISANIAGTTNISLSTFFGNEGMDDSAADHFGRRYFGARAALNQGLGRNHRLYLNLSWQSSGYHAVYPAFGITRSDEFYQAVAGWRWKTGRHLALRTEIQYYDNQSNIALFDYDRTQIMASLEAGL